MVGLQLSQTFFNLNCDAKIHRPVSEFKYPEQEEYRELFFKGYEDLHPETRYMVSIGGDGTFLSSIDIIRDKNIPVMGINTGRLGFLSNISVDDMDMYVKKIVKNELTYDERTLLHVTVNGMPAFDFPCALNDAVIHKSTAGLMTVHTWCNNEPLNSYWADGVIVATPTGSTAYSLSVGGPIVAPESQNFIISPIAAHNLNVRPLVIPDNVMLRLKPECRDKNDRFTLSLDSRSVECKSGSVIEIKRADFKIKTVKSTPFFTTLRNKLLWGMDKRNSQPIE